MRVLEGFGEDKEDDKTYYDNFLKSQHKASLTMIPHGGLFTPQSTALQPGSYLEGSTEHHMESTLSAQ